MFLILVKRRGGLGYHTFRLQLAYRSRFGDGKVMVERYPFLFVNVHPSVQGLPEFQEFPGISSLTGSLALFVLERSNFVFFMSVSFANASKHAIFSSHCRIAYSVKVSKLSSP